MNTRTVAYEVLLSVIEEGAYANLVLKEHAKRVKLLELIEFVHDYIANDIDFTPTDEPIALHITCSSKLMKIDYKILNLAQRCSTSVLVPEGVGCCGFAGDKGFTHPELNKYALRKLRPQIEKAGIKRGFSNRTTRKELIQPDNLEGLDN